MARKMLDRAGAGDNTHTATLRMPSSEFEQIAIVDKLLGNGMFYAITQNDFRILCRIRNKFKGRSRRANDVSIGKFVLIGLREWEKPHFKQADLLLVYDDFSFRHLFTATQAQLATHDNLLFTNEDTDQTEFIPDHIQNTLSTYTHEFLDHI